MRHDGGDAETGTGVEVGAGIRYAGSGVTVEGSVRGLVAHEASGYEEWGASGSVRIDPGASGRGLSLSYVVLRCVRPVIKRIDIETILTAPAPANVLERSAADVSFPRRNARRQVCVSLAVVPPASANETHARDWNSANAYAQSRPQPEVSPRISMENIGNTVSQGIDVHTVI